MNRKALALIVGIIIVSLGVIYWVSQLEISPPEIRDENGVQEWVLLQPTKCAKIPWRAGWAKEKDKPYEEFPLTDELEYLQDYYADRGVTILDSTLTYSTQDIVCEGCGCPESFVFAVLVYQGDAAKLAVSGFEILDQGDPNIFTSPLFRAGISAQSKPPPIDSDCENVFSTSTFLDILFGSSKDACYIESAINNKDESACDKVVSARGKNDCYTEVAILKKSVSPCEKIKESEISQGCIAQVAAVTQNQELCAVLTNQPAKEYCEMITKN
jgi:hypothetical protein